MAKLTLIPKGATADEVETILLNTHRCKIEDTLETLSGKNEARFKKAGNIIKIMKNYQLEDIIHAYNVVIAISLNKRQRTKEAFDKLRNIFRIVKNNAPYFEGVKNPREFLARFIQLIASKLF